jgi:hypothetical protein
MSRVATMSATDLVYRASLIVVTLSALHWLSPF